MQKAWICVYTDTARSMSRQPHCPIQLPILVSLANLLVVVSYQSTPRIIVTLLITKAQRWLMMISLCCVLIMYTQKDTGHAFVIIILGPGVYGDHTLTRFPGENSAIDGRDVVGCYPQSAAAVQELAKRIPTHKNSAIRVIG